MSKGFGADEGTKVYLGNLDERTSKRDLEEFLKSHGPIVDLWVCLHCQLYSSMSAPLLFTRLIVFPHVNTC